MLGLKVSWDCGSFMCGVCARSERKCCGCVSPSTCSNGSVSAEHPQWLSRIEQAGIPGDRAGNKYQHNSRPALRWMCFFTASRLRRYCEPLRHPTRPGLSLASCQLIHTAITAGTSRVAYGPHCVHAVANTPAGRMELVRSYNSIRFGLPTNSGRVGSCITIFGACLAFTHVTAYTLAESP